MRFSIVFDDNGTILAASLCNEEAAKPTPGPGTNRGEFDILDDLSDTQLHETVERLLVDMDAMKLTPSPHRKEAEDDPI
jgi:hypothetical protein